MQALVVEPGRTGSARVEDFAVQEEGVPVRIDRKSVV